MQKRTLYAGGRFFKGNLHTHSVRSDGKATPEQLADHYRKAGYSFLAITDHWVYGTHQELNREDFIMFPGTELDLELPGRKDHHIVSIGLPGANRIPDNYRFEKEQDGKKLCTAERMIEYLGSMGNMTIYGHPYWSKVDSTDIKNLHGMIGMEIYNHGSEFEGNNGNSETYFDHFLFVRNRLFCFATDDAHTLGGDSLGGFIMVKAEELSHDSIWKAIRDGSFYASSGPVIHDFYVEGQTAFVECGDCEDIYFQTPHRTGHLHGESGALRDGRFELMGGEEYVRVTVKDSRGRKAWSQPVWLWV